jgi:hypothetical protein
MPSVAVLRERWPGIDVGVSKLSAMRISLDADGAANAPAQSASEPSINASFINFPPATV